MTRATEHEPPLLDRDGEQRRAAALIGAAASGRGGALVLEGPAGIGKSRLLAAARAAARGAGLTVLAASGSELEAELPWGVARALLERAVRSGAADLLDGPARSAAPLLGREDAAVAASAALHGLYWLTANLAAAGPLLVCVDDLQWVDDPSRRFLAFLARRLDGLPVALVAAARPPLPGEERAALDALIGSADVLRPAPLGEAAVGALAAERLGERPEPGFAAACRRATGGNPLLVEALVRELAERGTAPVASELGQIGLDAVGEAVLRRVRALPPGAGALLRAAAVLGDGCGLETAASLARLAHDDAVAAAAALAAAEVLADGLPLAFRHPVVQASVRRAMPAVERAAAHGRAARVLAAAGAPGVAAQLLRSAPAGDGWVVERLREAAATARAQGAPEAAARLGLRALAEPPAPHRRAAVLRETGNAALAAGAPDALELLRAAVEAEPEPRAHAAVAAELVAALFDHRRAAEAAATARAALRRLDGRDPELDLQLRALLAECVRMDLGVSGDEADDLRRRVAALRGATPMERFAQATVALMDGDDTAAGHARAAAAVEALLERGDPAPGSPETGAISSYIRAGRLDAAERLVERRLAPARSAGDLLPHGAMLSMRGWIALERGTLAAAEADLRTAVALAVELTLPAAAAAALLACVEAEQGRGDAATATLAAHGLDGELPEHQVMNVVLFHRARVRLLQARHADAAADACELGRRYARWGLVRAVPAWRSLAAVAMRDRDPAGARRLAAEELTLARRWGTPSAIGLALRGHGLVHGDASRLAEAVDRLAASPARLELARGQIELGAALRRAGRRADARAPLRAGMDAARSLGALTLAARGRDELRATGARPRRLALTGAEALTASERRVAELAASGLTNRGIAQELFVTPATVETHLRHTFQKLGVGSRGALGAALSA